MEEFAEVFIGYLVHVVNPCYVTKAFCLNSEIRRLSPAFIDEVSLAYTSMVIMRKLKSRTLSDFLKAVFVKFCEFLLSKFRFC